MKLRTAEKIKNKGELLNKSYKKIVLTGGPCAGKSIIAEMIREAYEDEVLVVPEAASFLFNNGYPLAGRDLEFSDEWNIATQRAVFNLQLSLERTYELMAQEKGSSLIICDRGVFDNEAYAPGIITRLAEEHGFSEVELLNGYDEVIHLESLATSEGYSSENNESRLEDINTALRLNEATKNAWLSRTEVNIVPCYDSLEDKLIHVLKIIDQNTSCMRSEYVAE